MIRKKMTIKKSRWRLCTTLIFDISFFKISQFILKDVNADFIWKDDKVRTLNSYTLEQTLLLSLL